MKKDDIALFEEVADITRNMLAAAQLQGWERLAALEKHCVEYMERLKAADKQSLSSEAYERKRASIQSILEDDRKIKDLGVLWMMKLNSMMGNPQVVKNDHTDKNDYTRKINHRIDD